MLLSLICCLICSARLLISVKIISCVCAAYCIEIESTEIDSTEIVVNLAKQRKPFYTYSVFIQHYPVTV